VLCNLLYLWIVNLLGLAAPEWFFSSQSSTSSTNILSLLFSAFKIFCCTQTHTWLFRSHIFFPLFIGYRRPKTSLIRFSLGSIRTQAKAIRTNNCAIGFPKTAYRRCCPSVRTVALLLHIISIITTGVRTV
jgi:hypothetical protein